MPLYERVDLHVHHSSNTRVGNMVFDKLLLIAPYELLKKLIGHCYSQVVFIGAIDCPLRINKLTMKQIKGMTH